MWTFVASESQTYQKMNCPWQGNTLQIPHLKSPLLCLEWNTKSNVSPRWCIGPEIHWERLWHSWRSATWAAQERGKESLKRASSGPLGQNSPQSCEPNLLSTLIWWNYGWWWWRCLGASHFGVVMGRSQVHVWKGPDWRTAGPFHEWGGGRKEMLSSGFS